MVLRYLAFQIPSWALLALVLGAAMAWWDLSRTLAAAIFALFVLKDAVLFPFVRDAYGVEPRRPGAHLEGRLAVAEDALAPQGLVRLGAELWRARLAPGSPPVSRGGRVRIEAVEGLTLRVRADDAADG